MRFRRGEKFNGDYLSANVSLFDDLFEIIEGAGNILEPKSIQRYLMKYFHLLESKYKDTCGIEFVRERFDEAGKDYFNIEVFQ